MCFVHWNKELVEDFASLSNLALNRQEKLFSLVTLYFSRYAENERKIIIVRLQRM